MVEYLNLPAVLEDATIVTVQITHHYLIDQV